MEHGIQSLSLLCFIVFQADKSSFLQQQDGDDVEPGHQTYPYVSQTPGEICRLDGTVDSRCHQSNLQQEGEPGAINLAVDIGDVGFGDVVVGDYGGEREEEQCDSHEDAAKARHHALHGGLYITRACGNAGYACVNGCAIRSLHVVKAGDQQHEAGGGADKQGVDVDGKRLHQPLFGRVAYCGGRGGMGAGTLTRFVGIDPTLDAPHDGQTQNGTKTGVQTKGTLPDQQDHARQLANVEGYDDAGHYDVAQRHEGHYGTGKAGNPFDATEDDKAQQQSETSGSDVWINVKGGF